jgi:hypothetical protein
MVEAQPPAPTHETRETREPAAATGCLKPLFNVATTAMFLGFAVMCFVNVFASSVEVDQLAGQTACQGQTEPCEAMPMRWERLPWAHSMQVSTTGGTVIVKCKREYILVGGWGCEALSKPTPVTASSDLRFVPPRVTVPITVVIPAKPKPAAQAPTKAAPAQPAETASPTENPPP